MNDGLKKKTFEKKNQVPKKKCCAEKNGPFFAWAVLLTYLMSTT